MRKILFASSEVHPLIKTGGLADVSASLPIALQENGQDVRIVMPAYRQCLQQLTDFNVVANFSLEGYHEPVALLESRLPDSDVLLWLLHSPHHFDRDGGPYNDRAGQDWEDNAARFALFSRAIAKIAMNEAGLNWQPDVLHCNDWQTGLAPALIADKPNRPATLFTIHNLAYQGIYSFDAFKALDLPIALWHPEGVEFYGNLSFMKGGLIYADHITTVSPTYAVEICQPEYGCGLEGLLAHRNHHGRLSGILNGIDYHIWNPEHDKLIPKRYRLTHIQNKAVNKAALQRHFYLPENPQALLLGLISRLVAQKGIDLSIGALERLLAAGENIQFVCLGSGQPEFEQALKVLRAKYPDKVALTIGYNEPLSHQIEAGIDAFLMPSRFEPCGLNQMYSLRYGSLPIVRNTGGLADTVVDATEQNRQAGIANGFVFEQPTVEALETTLQRVLTLFQRPRIWRNMMKNAMKQDFSWANSANLYIELYDRIINR